MMDGQTLSVALVNNNYIEKLKPANLGGGWENLPSIILLEIFSYLPSESRICASQACRHWRNALFHPRFWKKITFSLTDNERVIWSRCLSNWFKFTVQDVTIRCETSNIYVRETFAILKKLCYNKNLRKLFLEPSRCFFEYPTRDMNAQKLQKLLLNIIERAKSLDTLSLGYIEELTEDPNVLLECLEKYQSNNVTTLSLASVKDDPDHYEFLEIQQTLFQSFNKLVILTIDYDHINDNLLSSLSSGIMERLVIHVHGWSVEYLGASNEVWRQFAQKNPHCRLRLNLIHSYNAVNVLDSHILKPSMPLSHIKVLFCEGQNTAALHHISAWYSETLQSIIWIDSINRKKVCVNSPAHIENLDNPDPLVLAAWRCKRLRELVFIGLKYTPDNLLAIVRLRQDTLTRLEFAESDVVSCDDSYTEYFVILEEIKDVMGDKWKLLTDAELPDVVKNPLKSDSREVILPMVFQDQK